MAWKFILSDGQKHDITHLSGFVFGYVQQASKGKEAKIYSLDVEFSWHCFTKEAKVGDAHIITRNREQRCFCPDRYALSFRLPDLILSLDRDMCRQTGKGNFLLIKVVDAAGVEHDYEIYFQITKRGKRQNMLLSIESAYVRTKVDHYRSKKKPIRFSTIVFNRLHNKQIRS